MSAAEAPTPDGVAWLKAQPYVDPERDDLLQPEVRQFEPAVAMAKERANA